MEINCTLLVFRVNYAYEKINTNNDMKRKKRTPEQIAKKKKSNRQGLIILVAFIAVIALASFYETNAENKVESDLKKRLENIGLSRMDSLMLNTLSKNIRDNPKKIDSVKTLMIQKNREEKRADIKCDHWLDENMYHIYSYTEDAVKMKLKSPSTATFPSYADENTKILYMGNCLVVIHSWVDSENGFGAMIRSKYTAKINISSEKVDVKSVSLPN